MDLGTYRGEHVRLQGVNWSELSSENRTEYYNYFNTHGDSNDLTWIYFKDADKSTLTGWNEKAIKRLVNGTRFIIQKKQRSS